MKKLILLMGPAGSGKTTYYNEVLDKEYNCTRISQDEMGRKKHLICFYNALSEEKEVIVVDRMNFNIKQRSSFIEPAKKAGYTIEIIHLDVDYNTCFDRILKRQGHPTVKGNDPELARKILDMYFIEFERPLNSEYSVYEMVYK